MTIQEQTYIQLYVLVDACSATLATNLAEGLRKMANTLSVLDCKHIQPGIGLCLIHRSAASKDVQLQVVMQPHNYNLRDFHAATKKIRPSDACLQEDDKKLALSVKNMVDHLKSQQKGSSNLVQHLHVIAHGYKPLPTYKKLLEEAGCHSIHVKFFCMDAASEEQYPQANAALAQFVAGIAPFEHATFRRYDCDADSISHMLLNWLSEAFNPEITKHVKLVCSKPLAGKTRFACNCMQQIVQLKATIDAVTVCPCHQLPVGQIHDQQKAQHSCLCPVSKEPLESRMCKRDARAAQLGHFAHLRFSTLSRMPELVHGQSEVLEPKLEILRVLKAASVNQALVYGMPYLLNAAPCEQILATTSSSNATNDEAFAALTRSLLLTSSVLLASSAFDLDSGKPGAFKSLYILQPATDGGFLLCRKVASNEQLLAFADISTLPEPPEQLVEQACKDLEAIRDEMPHTDACLPTQLSAGYHDIINQMVKDSVKIAAVTPISTHPTAPASHPDRQQVAKEQSAEIPRSTTAAPHPEHLSTQQTATRQQSVDRPVLITSAAYTDEQSAMMQQAPRAPGIQQPAPAAPCPLPAARAQPRRSLANGEGQPNHSGNLARQAATRPQPQRKARASIAPARTISGRSGGLKLQAVQPRPTGPKSAE